MKKIITSNITTTAGMPLKSGSVDHLQSAYQEAIREMAIPIIGSQYTTSDYFIMRGCKNTGSGLNYIISAGSIYFNDEVYLVDAATFTAGVGQVAVGTITTTYFNAANADPTVFTDGSSHNVNAIRKIVFAAGTSGSGDVDFDDLKPVGLEDRHEVGATGEPPFQNVWSSSSYLSFRKDWTKKMVHFEGEIDKATYTGVQEVTFTLSSPEYYPSYDRYFEIVQVVSPGTNYRFEVKIKSSNGEVSITSLDGTFAPTNITIIFDGKYFFTD